MQKFIVRACVSFLALVALCVFSTCVSAQAVPGGGDGGDNNTPVEPAPIQDNELTTLGGDTLGAGEEFQFLDADEAIPDCLLYTSPSPRDATLSRMPSSA